jgi:signal transduction histidine kinase/ligand-binding sensor domain-containing protein
MPNMLRNPVIHAMGRRCSIYCWLVIFLPWAWGDTSHGASRRGEFATTVGNWLVQTWESEDGLPENSATAMVQTPDHYLWFGTFNGLVRFDGVRFTVFDTSNTPELPSSGIVNLHLDRAGRLWVSTLKGLVWREGNQWGVPRGVNPNGEDFVRTFAENSNGEILLTTFGGKIFEFANGALWEMPVPPGTIGQGFLGVVDDDGRWWVMRAGFIGRWTGQEWERMIPAADLTDVPGSRLICGTARRGGIWILIGTELRRVQGGKEVERRQVMEEGCDVWSLYEDSRGNVWICTPAKGVIQVEPDGRRLLWDEASGASYHGVRFAFEDLEGNVWIGTSGGGLMRFKTRRFNVIGPDQGLTERVVKTVHPSPQGGIWVGTYGASLFHLKHGVIHPVDWPKGEPTRRYIQSVLADRQGRTWLGCFADGLVMLTPSVRKTIPTRLTGGGNILSLFEDSRGRIWAAGGHGIGVCEGEEFREFGVESGVPKAGVRAFCEDRLGRIWMSNFDGVFRLEGDRWNEVVTPGGKSYREVTCFWADSDDTLWMGTLNDGLIRWRTDRVDHIHALRGLPVRGVYSMVADHLGHLWMSSSQGIARTSRKVLNDLANGPTTVASIQVLDRNDGLESGECPSGQQPIAARDAKGRLWFATLKGVASIDPAEFKANPVLVKAIVESLLFRSGARALSRGVSREHRIHAPFPSELKLPPGSHRLEVHYTAPSFASPTKLRFQFRLDDQPWRDAGTRRTAYFENLAPGRYQFQVRAANDDGIWNLDPTTLTFAVLPQFWQTTIFQGLVCCVGLVSVLGWNHRRRVHQRIERDNQTRFTRLLIASQNAERARIARELHDDLCQRLARLAIDAGQIENSPPNSDGRQALREVREGLVQLSEDVHAISYRLHPSVLADLGLAEALRAECERISRRNPIEVVVKVDGIPEDIPREQALCLFRVGEEALQNVIRHASARRVEVVLRGVDGGIQLAVQDDGAGFNPEVQRQRPSLGLSGMQERVHLLNGQLDIESSPGSGTVIVGWLPLTGTPL